MPNIQKITDPLKIVTDPVLLSVLMKQGIDKDYVEFFQDYSPRALGKEHSPYAKFYKDLLSDKRWMVVSSLPMVKVEGLPIEAGWYYSKNKHYSKANLFSAVVQGKKVQITCLSDQPDGRKLGDRLTYSPQLFLNDVEQICGISSLLLNDPLNSSSCQCHSYRPTHYSENTLEWDYGICKRRLRIIEGSILGSWVFDQKPNGEIRIKYNQTGDFRLKLGHFAISKDEEVIKPEDFDELAKFEGGYPVTITDSDTYYPGAEDGFITAHDAVYSTVHNATSGDAPYKTQVSITLGNFFASSLYFIYRAFIPLDTSSLPDAATLFAGNFSIYGVTDLAETDNGQSDLLLYQGLQQDTLVYTDYNDFGTTALSNDFTNWQYPIPLNAYSTVNLNASGIALINKTGLTKFCVRIAGDVNTSTPTGYNYQRFYTSEQGSGYKPKLVVNYNIKPRHGFVNFQDPGIL